MKILNGGLENVRGFSFSARECGIKYENKLDLALIHSSTPCNASGLFTKNRIFAAPVKLCRERIGNRIHSILMNSNNANASTGQIGYQNALVITDELARQLDIASESVLMASTGVIGVQLPVNKIISEIPHLVKGLSAENARLVPIAIMTTDTRPKEFAVSFSSSMGDFNIGGIAKGSGMIAPDMATLLSFLITDAPLERKDLDTIFRKCINDTLNSITIDGDMSTNDTAIILSPISDNYLNDSKDLRLFEDSLMAVLTKLSSMLIDDGEGATKSIKVVVSGAKTDEDAKKAAKTISESLLVKTAIFGKDPNWGRIACAAGYSGAEIEEENLSISFENIKILERGTPLQFDKETLDKIMSRREYTINIDLGMGRGKSTFMTTDISYDYIKINSEYTT
jgi:glutamate N-acetyltransferase/amino-acid N-acetyltransferase